MFGNTLLIVNPQAQNGRARHLASLAQEQISNALGSQNSNPMLETIFTNYPLDATIIARELSDSFDSIFALGGDGLVHEVVNGLMQLPADQRATLGVIPCGHGNDFARSLNMPLNTKKTLNRLPLLFEHKIDLGKVNEKYFVETLSFGVDAAIALETTERRRLSNFSGPILYVQSGYNQIMNNLNLTHATVSFDDRQPMDLDFYTFAIQNGQTYGAGFEITPKASLFDGHFDICYATGPLSAKEAITLFGKARKGNHTSDPNIHFEKAQKIVLDFEEMPPTQADGEPYPAYHFEVSILPQELKVYLL